MKQTKEMDRIQQEMRPGVVTASGFLGGDRRPLADILDADHATVLRLGVTHAAIAARMEELRHAGAKGLGLAVRVESVFDVQVDAVRGKLPCPFRHAGLFGKVTTTVVNIELGRQVIYSDLTVHLIEAHGFYGGLGALFRCDPADLVRILDVRPVGP